MPSCLLNSCFLVPQCRYLLIITVILSTMDTKGLDSQIILVHLFLFLMILHVPLQHFKACLYCQYSKTSYHPLMFLFGFALYRVTFLDVMAARTKLGNYHHQKMRILCCNISQRIGFYFKTHIQGSTSLAVIAVMFIIMHVMYVFIHILMIFVLIFILFCSAFWGPCSAHVERVQC